MIVSPQESPASRKPLARRPFAGRPGRHAAPELATRLAVALAVAATFACSGGGIPSPSAPGAAPPEARGDAKGPGEKGPVAPAAAGQAAAGATSPSTAAVAPAPAPTVDPSVALKPSTLSTTAQADDGDTTDAPLTVRFSVEVEPESGRPPFRHVWDFGDATPAVEGASPTHVYRLPGHFRASVMTVDADGQYDQDWVDLMVLPNYEAMGLSPEEIQKRVQAAREATRKALEAMPGGLGAPGSGAP